jgi:hypothetical protein
MTTPFPFVAAQTLTAQQLNDITNLPINDQTASYTAVVGDAGKRIVMNVASANTVTINNSIFTTGDTLFIANKGAGISTLTAGAGVTINTSGSLALAQHGGGTLVALSASVFTFFSGGAVGAGVATGGSSSSITVGGINYTLLTFTSDSTLTVTKSGLFDLFICSGGGGGGRDAGGAAGSRGGGGGAGGVLQLTNVYLSANQTVTVGAGGAAGTDGANGTPGASSKVGDFQAMQGGGGASVSGAPSESATCAGGSMGGGTKNTTFNTLGQGNKGGLGSSPDAGAGGGGKGAVGGDGSGTTGGAGGAGTDVSTFIGGSALFKAAGAGGAGNTTLGTGGSSIGGNGGTSGTNATSAAANTASGGGGAASNRTAGAGGSGIVYVRFKV